MDLGLLWALWASGEMELEILGFAGMNLMIRRDDYTLGTETHEECRQSKAETFSRCELEGPEALLV